MLVPIIAQAVVSERLSASPIDDGSILEGDPVATAKLVAKSRDRLMWVSLWHCTPGTFDWRYAEDEVVYILSGEVFLSSGGGAERRLGAGDVALFPAKSACRWRVTQPLRKVAVLRKQVPRPLSLAIRAWNRLLLALTPRRAPASSLSG